MRKSLAKIVLAYVVPVLGLLLACAALRDAFTNPGLRPARQCTLPDSSLASWTLLPTLVPIGFREPHYKAWRFTWGKAPSSEVNVSAYKHVVAFIHGNAGHHHESRTILTQLWREGLQRPEEVLLLTFDFAEEANIHSGGMVMRQASFVAQTLQKITCRFPENATHRVVVVGHSMGGIVARAALKLLTVAPASASVNVVSLVTLATPHAAPPIYVDSSIAAVYRSLSSEDSLLRTDSGPAATLVISIGSGSLDDQVHPSLTVLGPWAGPFHLHVEPERVASAVVSDHSSAPWCGEVIGPLARTIAFGLEVANSTHMMYDMLDDAKARLGVRSVLPVTAADTTKVPRTVARGACHSKRPSSVVFIVVTTAAIDAASSHGAPSVLTAMYRGHQVPLARLDPTPGALVYATLVHDLGSENTAISVQAFEETSTDGWTLRCVEADSVLDLRGDEREYWPWPVVLHAREAEGKAPPKQVPLLSSLDGAVVGACVDLRDEDRSMGMATRSIRVLPSAEANRGEGPHRSWVPFPIDGLHYHPASVLRCGVASLDTHRVAHVAAATTELSLGQRFNALRNTLTINAVPLASVVGLVVGTAWWALGAAHSAAASRGSASSPPFSAIRTVGALCVRVAWSSMACIVLLVASSHMSVHLLLVPVRSLVEVIGGCSLDALGGVDQSAVAFAQHGRHWMDLAVLAGLTLVTLLFMACFFMFFLFCSTVALAVWPLLPTRVLAFFDPRLSRHGVLGMAVLVAAVFHPAHVSLVLHVVCCFALGNALLRRDVSLLVPALAVAPLTIVTCVTTSVFFVWRNGFVSRTWPNEPSSLEQRLLVIQVTALFRFLRFTSPHAKAFSGSDEDNGPAGSDNVRPDEDENDTESAKFDIALPRRDLRVSKSFRRWCACFGTAVSTVGLLAFTSAVVGDDVNGRYQGAVPGQFNLSAVSVTMVCTLLATDALLVARWFVRHVM